MKSRFVRVMAALALSLAACDDGESTGGGSPSADAAGGADGATTDATRDAGPADGTAPEDGARPDMDGGGSDAGPPPGPCGNTPESLRDCVDRDAYVEDLEFIAAPRPIGSEHWQAVQDRCAEELEALGFQVTRHRFPAGVATGVNVIGVLPGTEKPDEYVLISAHYDSVPECNGAADNASAVAGALEAARVLATQRYARSLMVACWDDEERDTTGSIAFATWAQAQGLRITAAFVLEMIGYATDEPDTQRLPDGLGALFPDEARWVEERENRGDFIAIIGDRDLNPGASDAMEVHAAEIGLPLVKLTLLEALRTDDLASAVRRSDHAPFWDAGYPAIMVTDTSEYRNPYYHCAWGMDSVDTLNIDFAVKVVRTVVGAAADQLEVRPGEPSADAGIAPDAGVAPPDRCDVLAQDCPDGQRCIALPAQGRVFPTCHEVLGDAGREEPCERPPYQDIPQGVPGIDTCAPGLFCTYWGLPQADPQPRRCVPYCRVDADCPDGGVCMMLGFLPRPGWANIGACIAPCDPFDPDACAEGTTCRSIQKTDWGTGYTCLWGGPQTEEMSCAEELCASGLDCVALVGTPHRWSCHRFCDDDHPCPDGKRCVRTAYYDNASVRYCATPR